MRTSYTMHVHDDVQCVADLIEHHVVVVPAGISHDSSLLWGIEHWDTSLGQGLELERGDVGRSLTRVLALRTHRNVLLSNLCLRCWQLKREDSVYILTCITHRIASSVHTSLDAIFCCCGLCCEVTIPATFDPAPCPTMACPTIVPSPVGGSSAMRGVALRLL